MVTLVTNSDAPVAAVAPPAADDDANNLNNIMSSSSREPINNPDVPATVTASAAAANATIPAAVSKESEEVNPNDDKVCRFLITDISAARGYTKTDYRIDLLQSKHGLYDIATTVFEEILDKEKLTDDRIYSHLWSMTFNKKTYNNGWRRQTFPDSNEWNRPAEANEVDVGERRLFSGFDAVLEIGQKGQFSGESASFDYVLESLTDVSSAVPASKNKGKEATSYPLVSKVPNSISSKVEDDWLTPAQKSQCTALQETWKRFYKGNNSWKQVKRPGHRAFTRAKPTAPQWGPELKIMGLLINADCKFKKCWNNILQYAFVDRTEAGCSMRWYQLKKEDYRLQYYGRGMSSTARISLAKRLAKTMMKDQLERKKPKRERHPYADAREERLREIFEEDLYHEGGY